MTGRSRRWGSRRLSSQWGSFTMRFVSGVARATSCLFAVAVFTCVPVSAQECEVTPSASTPQLPGRDLACGEDATSQPTTFQDTMYRPDDFNNTLASVAIGQMAWSAGPDNTAIGSGAMAGYLTTNGTLDVGGTDYYYWVLNSVQEATAIGASANAQADFATALGANTVASAQGAVAIGAGSVADQADTVSFGNAALQRRLTNLSDGTADSDAATVGQMNAAVAGISVDTNAALAATQANTASIATNTAAIAGNTSAIAGNTNAIADLQSGAAGVSARIAYFDVNSTGAGASAGGVNALALGREASAEGETAMAIGLRSAASGAKVICSRWPCKRCRQLLDRDRQQCEHRRCSRSGQRHRSQRCCHGSACQRYRCRGDRRRLRVDSSGLVGCGQQQLLRSCGLSGKRYACRLDRSGCQRTDHRQQPGNAGQ